MSYRFGIDVGGTFTDGVLVDEATGAASLVKVSSTPRDPSVGFMETSRAFDAGRRVPQGTLTP